MIKKGKAKQIQPP
jgi:hypothetical protein